MNDHLLERLRNLVGCTDSILVSDALEDAADEIERLRAVLRQIEALDNTKVPVNDRLALARSYAHIALHAS